MDSLTIAIIGAGAGGQCMAGHLASLGCHVRLHDIDTQKISDLRAAKTIVLSGKLECEGKPECITTDYAEAVRGADIIMVVTTTDAHGTVAREIAPYVTAEQKLLLNPGHAGGALEVISTLKSAGCKTLPVVGESPTLVYGCRAKIPGQVFVTGVKKTFPVSAIPAQNAQVLVDALLPIYPQMKALPNNLNGLLSGTGCLLHVIPTLMNANLADRKIPYDFYMEGITPSVAELIHLADLERLAVAEKMGVKLKSLNQWLKDSYDLEEGPLYDMLQANKAYVGSAGPQNFNHRFVVEDIASGFVPISSFGKAFGVPTPVIDSFILIGSHLCGRNYAAEGRSLERLGLAGMTPEEIVATLL